jgi:hypothetical protein
MALLDQFLTDFLLIAVGLVVHIENLIARAHVLLRVPVTIEAPFHQQRSLLRDRLHFIDLAMTARAANSLAHVNAVIEINKIGQPVHTLPFDRFARPVAFADRFEHGATDPDLRVAVHAGFGRRNAGKGGIFHRGVAIATIDAQPADVMRMAELNRLRDGDAFVGCVGRADKERHGPADADEKKDRAEDADLGDNVETVMENLRHYEASATQYRSRTTSHEAAPDKLNMDRPLISASSGPFVLTVAYRSQAFVSVMAYARCQSATPGLRILRVEKFANEILRISSCCDVEYLRSIMRS